MPQSVVSKAAAVLLSGLFFAAAAAFSASTDAHSIPSPAETAVETTQTAPTTQTTAARETQTLPDRKMVALTFDDGPSVPHTDKILDLLTKYGARATFFVVGQRVADYAQVLRRERELGCQIGNHTFDHKTLTGLSPESIRSQVRETDDAVFALLGAAPQILRAPGGNVNNKVKAAADKPIVLWSVDTEDWRYGGKAGRETPANREKVIRAAVDGARDGDIILMHDLYAMTAQCCETIIPRLQDAGFELVTVEELMAYKQIKMEKGVVYRNARTE